MNLPSFFTAAQIGRALGKTKRSVWRALVSVKPSSVLPLAGGEAAAWSITALPVSMQTELAAEASRRGCRDVAALLQYAPAPWQPPVPVSEIHQKHITRASLLREALAAPLARQHEMEPADLRELGLGEFNRVLGYSISAKQWDRLFDRTVSRDAGAENWPRLELYLDEIAFPKARKPVVVKSSFSLQPIDDAIAGLSNKSKLSALDAAWLFHCAFRHAEQLAGEGHRERDVKSAIIEHLFSRLGAGISKSESALRRTFDNKRAAWLEGGRTHTAILDKRPLKSGSPAYSCPPCETKFNHQSRQFRGPRGTKGNDALAWRLLWNNDELCPACKERYSFDMRKNKSYVPRNFRRRASPRELEIANDQSWKKARDIGPYISGNHDGFEPGYQFVFDDETPNQVAFTYVDGELLINCVQNIEGIDERSEMPLGFNMYIGAPSAAQIRLALDHVFATVGLPDYEIKLEGGVFAARMIIGDDEPSWTETEAELARLFGIILQTDKGVREAGIEIHHATTPSAKGIEGYFNHTQMRGSLFPGTVGNRQRDEMPDRLKEFIARAKAGKEDPRNELLSLDELRKNYVKIREEFMHTPKNGKKHRGATPWELWQERISRKPLRKLPPELRYITATHKKTFPLRERGIRWDVSQYDDAIYASAELGKWYGCRVREVIAFRSLYDASQIVVSDLKMQNFLSVPRISAPKFRASKEQLETASKLKRGYIAQATSGFGKLTHPLSYTVVRDTDHTDEQRALGRFQANAEETRRAVKSEQEKMVDEVRKLEAALGEPPMDLNTHRRPRQYLDSLRWKMETRRDSNETPETTIET